MKKLYRFPTGITGGKSIEKDHADGETVQPVENTAPLSSLINDYVLFNYAPLFLYGGVTFNPIQAWVNEVNPGKVVKLLKLPKLILHMGPGQPSPFGAVLWA